MSFKVSKILQFPQSTLQYIPQDECSTGPARGLPLLGGVLSDTHYVWHAKGPCLEVRNTKTGTKVGAWTFGCILKDSNTKVVCVDEIQRTNGRLSLLAVGIECTISGGLICIFDVFGSKVIRAIQIKEKISSLHVVDSGCEVLNLPGPLRNFDGIISVGTEGGNVLLVDVCRQICDEALHAATVRDELCPCQIVLLTLKDISRIEYYKEQSVREGDHLAIHLNVVLHSLTQHFTLKGPNGEDRIHVNREEVITSALYYCPQLTSLLVGFNFGAFQLWDLTSLALIYTSPVCGEHLPITHFALQEPADDPRAFCYIWVSYSNSELFQSGLPFAVMYSVSYESKEYHEGYGYLYQDFQSCSIRFQVELGQLEDHRCGSKAKGGSCLALQPICRVPPNKDLYSHDSTGDILALCVISWTVWFSQSETQTCMLVFDLNQWYKDQMPEFTKWNDSSNYILKVSVSDLLLMTGRKGGLLIDIKIDKKSLRQFIGVQRFEEHFCPSALSFDLWGLRENDAILLHNEGVQKALLTQIEAAGPLCLIRPNDIYRQIIILGLTPLFVDITTNIPVSTDVQREIILNVGLEHQLVGWLCKCASEWANGSFSSAGCSLDFLIHWAFQRAVVLKTNCDKYCMPLFDYSQSRLDNNTSILLNSCTRQIMNLCTFYSYILNKLTSFISNRELVVEQHMSLKMVSMYFEVLQWLVNVGLLPECHPSTYPRPDNTERISAPYPIQELTEYYNEKRAQLQLLTKETFVSSDSLLFIDNLINNKCGAEQLQKQWQEDGGSGLYPPPSLQSMLRTYLVEGADISHKHSLIIYIFLDLAMALDQNKHASVITHLIKFPAVFKVTSSVIKITQAFWQLDHGDYTTAMEQLLDPFVLNDDLQPWHHAIAMRALLLQNQYNFALLYMQVRKPPITDEKDVLTAISLFIANNMLDEAFYFKNQHKNINEEKLLMHLFNECSKNDSLHVLLYRSLNTAEEKTFFNYLKSVQNPTSGDLQVFYYLLRSRFVEAFDAHNISKGKKPESQGLIGQRNATKTDQIVRIFKTLLPDVNRNLVDLIQRERTNLWKEVARPTPFSVFVHNTKEQIHYKSTVIHAALAKAKHTFNDSANNMRFKEILTEETPFLRTPRASRSSSSHSTPIITPKIIEINECGEEMGPSPAKKLKLTPRAATTSPTYKRSISIYAKMLTPIVKRKTSLQKDQSTLSISSFSVCTPQSILKVRNLVRNGDALSDDTRINDTLEDYEGLARIESSPKKSGLGLLPRKSLTRTPRRPHVQFDDAARFSSSFSDQSIKPSLNNTVLEEQSYDKSTSSKEVSLIVSSKNSSSSNTEDVFYSPNSSLDELSREEIVPPNQIKTQSNAYKAVDEHEDEVSSSDNMVSITQSPKARRSYKRSLCETLPVRSSPRLIKHSLLPTEETNLDVPKESVVVTTLQESDKPTLITGSVLSDDSLQEEDSESYKQYPRILQKLKGRKSLSRQVLEHNTFTRVLSSPLIMDKSVSKEMSLSKSEKTAITKKSSSVSEITTIETKTEISDISISEPNTPVSRHKHTASKSVSKKKIFDTSLDSNTSVECNICLDSPELPERLKMSDSLLEYIISRNNKSDVDRKIDAGNKLQSDSEPSSPQSSTISTSKKNILESSLECDTSVDYNICLDSPELPETLKISQSLLEYMKSRRATSSTKDDSHIETDYNKVHIEEDEELRDQTKDSLNLDDGKFPPEQMDIYEDLSSGAEDIEEVLAASKQQCSSKVYTELSNCSENAYNMFEQNIFEVSQSRVQSFEDQIGQQNIPTMAEPSSLINISYLSVPNKCVEEKFDVSGLSTESYQSVDKAFIAEDQTPKVLKQESDVIEIGSSSDEDGSTKSDHTDSSASRSIDKSESDMDDMELNISYEHNIHIEENSRSLVDSDVGAEHNSESEGDENVNAEERVNLMERGEQSNTGSEIDLNEDNSSVEWINNNKQSEDENEHPEIETEEVEVIENRNDNQSENTQNIEPGQPLQLEEVFEEVIENNDVPMQIIEHKELEVIIEKMDSPKMEDIGEENESDRKETLALEEIIEGNEINKEENMQDVQQNLQKSTDSSRINSIIDNGIQTKSEGQQTDKTGSVLEDKTTDAKQDENENKNQSTNTVTSEGLSEVESSSKCNETVEQSTNTIVSVPEREHSFAKNDDVECETNKSKEIQIYYPKYSTMKVIADDRTMSSVSSDTTEGEITREEIVVTAQVHNPSKRRLEIPLIKRITRRSSAHAAESDMFGSDPDKSVDSSQKVIDKGNISSTCETPEEKSNDKNPNEVSTPGKRTRRSQSATLTPTRSIKTRRSSQIDIEEEVAQTSTSKEVEKELGPKLRRTRSGSVDEMKNTARKRSLRSNSIDEKVEETELEEQKPKTRGKAGSVSQMPVISEEAKDSRTSQRNKANSTIETYATNRRLTRRQASLVKGIETPSNITAHDDSDVEKVLDIDAIDPIKLLDKEPFQGNPDPEEEKIYEPSSPSNSTTSSFNKPAKRLSRSASVTSDTSIPPSTVTTPKRRTRQSISHLDSPSQSGVKTRSRKQSETSSIASEKSSPPTPPKRAKKNDHPKNVEETSSNVSVAGSVRSTRSRTISISSVKSDMSNSPIKNTRSRRLVSTKSDLPEIIEEKGIETAESTRQQTTKRQPRKKSSS